MESKVISSFAYLPPQFFIVTFSGSNIANARGQFSSKTSLAQSSNTPKSIFESLFDIPIRSQNNRMAEGGTPRRRMPDIVGILGSSHPVT